MGSIHCTEQTPRDWFSETFSKLALNEAGYKFWRVYLYVSSVAKRMG